MKTHTLGAGQFHSYATVEIYEVLEGVDIEKEKKNEQTKTKKQNMGRLALNVQEVTYMEARSGQN